MDRGVAAQRRARPRLDLAEPGGSGRGAQIMCVTLTVKMFGAALFFQGCVTMEPITLPQKVAPPPPPITTQDWAPLVAKADADDDGSITYLFRDLGGRVRTAVANCGDTMPKEDDGKVM